MAQTASKFFKWVRWSVVLVAITGAALYFLIENYPAVLRTITANREGEKPLATLPGGAEDAWLAYVDRRVHASLQRQGTTLDVMSDFDIITGRTTIVSLGTPYQVDCDPISGGVVTFGKDAESEPITVSIFGPLANANPKVEKSPPLGIDPTSAAAHDLNGRLCHRIAEDVQAIVG